MFDHEKCFGIFHHGNETAAARVNVTPLVYLSNQDNRIRIIEHITVAPLRHLGNFAVNISVLPRYVVMSVAP